ncbi:hypothetical protein [Chitinimonas lacunae]|uniref:DUF4254 domain-containing protein n=1 Tax=Chitinimonas lacunae TaxID=1963018 RepID=A0ABV8MWG8_9NEIS
MTRDDTLAADVTFVVRDTIRLPDLGNALSREFVEWMDWYDHQRKIDDPADVQPSPVTPLLDAFDATSQPIKEAGQQILLLARKDKDRANRLMNRLERLIRNREHIAWSCDPTIEEFQKCRRIACHLRHLAQSRPPFEGHTEHPNSEPYDHDAHTPDHRNRLYP